MGWTELTTPVTPAKANAAGAAVRISGTDGGKFAVQRTIVSINAALIPAELQWMKPDVSCKVLLGQDGDAGKIKIRLGGTFPLRRSSNSKRVMLLRLPKLPGRMPGKFATEAVDWQQVNDSIEIVLPSWCRGGKPVTAVRPLA